MPVEDPNKSNILNVKTIKKGIDVETVKPCVKIFKEYIAVCCVLCVLYCAVGCVFI